MPRKKSAVNQRIEELDEMIRARREGAMEAAGYTSFGQKQIASFHGKIGGKNNVYVDAVREKFLSPQQFLTEWKKGALKKAKQSDKYSVAQNTAAHKIIRYLQNKRIHRYTDLFLERNFYRQYLERTRNKPEDALWEIWFGSKNQEYGLFITPVYRDGWFNDVSEIRRVKFDYWTIGHVLNTGFIIPKKKRVHAVADLDALFDLYQNVFVRMTGSVYSSRFAEKYEEYVRHQDDPDAVPFLIPEFRFEGVKTSHKYRLDFTILSASQNRKVGIELSPWSSHGRVTGKNRLRAKGGEQAVDAERLHKWEAEMKKRNAYFKKYGLTTVTFTDSDLQNMDECFGQIKEYLTPASAVTPSLPAVKNAILNYHFDSKDLDDE